MLKKNTLKSVCCLLILLFMTGCSEQPEDAPSAANVGPKTLRIALIPEIDIFSQKKRYEPLVKYLEGKQGVVIDLKILSRYGNIIDNFVSKDLDAAFFGSFTGALALKKLGVTPLARPEGDDGISTYFGMVFARKDSHINNAADMKGKRFAFVDKATTAGWLLPLHFFGELGIEDYQSWFGETYFTGTHDDAIYDVLNGNADIGAAKNTVFDRLAAQDSRILDELEIISTSMPVPENGLAVRPGLDEGLVAGMKKTLLTMDQDPEGKGVLAQFGAARFIETTAADYKVVLDFADHIGLDLGNYHYVNN
ncbi:MAG: phosphate/phosphite/phosphonate ABC transporter substrate-binding protein [Thermodesulfobacteriota bacterium]